MKQIPVSSVFVLLLLDLISSFTPTCSVIRVGGGSPRNRQVQESSQHKITSHVVLPPLSMSILGHVSQAVLVGGLFMAPGVNTMFQNQDDDPEKVLNQALREMQKELTNIRRTYQEITEHQSRLLDKKDEADTMAQNWNAKLHFEMQTKNEQMVNEAKARLEQYTTEVKDLEDEIRNQNISLGKLYEGIQEVESRIATNKAKKEQMVSRYRTAESTVKLNDMLSGATGKTSVDKFNKMEMKIEAMEVAAGVSGQMASKAISNENLKKKENQLRQEDAVNQEFKRMKDSLTTDTRKGNVSRNHGKVQWQTFHGSVLSDGVSEDSQKHNLQHTKSVPVSREESKFNSPRTSGLQTPELIESLRSKENVQWETFNGSVDINRRENDSRFDSGDENKRARSGRSVSGPQGTQVNERNKIMQWQTFHGSISPGSTLEEVSRQEEPNKKRKEARETYQVDPGTGTFNSFNTAMKNQPNMRKNPFVTTSASTTETGTWASKRISEKPRANRPNINQNPFATATAATQPTAGTATFSSQTSSNKLKANQPNVNQNPFGTKTTLTSVTISSQVTSNKPEANGPITKNQSAFATGTTSTPIGASNETTQSATSNKPKENETNINENPFAKVVATSIPQRAGIVTASSQPASDEPNVDGPSTNNQNPFGAYTPRRAGTSTGLSQLASDEPKAEESPTKYQNPFGAYTPPGTATATATGSSQSASGEPKVEESNAKNQNPFGAYTPLGAGKGLLQSSFDDPKAEGSTAKNQNPFGAYTPPGAGTATSTSTGFSQSASDEPKKEDLNIKNQNPFGAYTPSGAGTCSSQSASDTEDSNIKNQNPFGAYTPPGTGSSTSLSQSVPDEPQAEDSNIKNQNPFGGYTPLGAGTGSSQKASDEPQAEHSNTNQNPFGGYTPPGVGK